MTGGNNRVRLKNIKPCVLRKKLGQMHVNLGHCQGIEIDFSLIQYDASIFINARLNEQHGR